MIQSHLKLAHQYWNAFLKKGDHVIDATCGNGHDSLALAQMVLNEKSGGLLCIDIQQKALDAAKLHLNKNLPFSHFKRISYLLGCHSTFPSLSEAPRLIVYNLGYLPGGDKSVVTTTSKTLKSLERSLEILPPGGALSITCYSGHEEGEKEEEEVLSFARSLSKDDYQVCHHRWLNRSKAPSLFLIQKS